MISNALHPCGRLTPAFHPLFCLSAETDVGVAHEKGAKFLFLLASNSFAWYSDGDADK
jgi:hypothetical protein